MSARTSWLAGLLGAAVLSGPTAGIAEPEAAPEASESVAGAAEGADPDVERIRVTGFRTGILPDRPSASASVIDLSDYAGEHKSVEDVLAETVGVQVRRFGGAGERSEVSIRGSTSSQVVILLDGVRVNSEQQGAVDLSQIPIEFLERIEVVRGGGGADEGSGAVGGVIRLVSKRPGATPNTTFSASGGSWGTWQGSLFRSARALGLDYTAGYSGFTTDGNYRFQRPIRVHESGLVFPPNPAVVTRINNDADRHAFTGGIGRAFGEKHYMSLHNDASYTSRGQPGLDSGSGENAGQRTDARERVFRNIARLDWEASELGLAGDELLGKLWYRFERTRFRDPLPAPIDPIAVTADNSAFGLSLKDTWNNRFGWFGLEVQGRQDRFDSTDEIDPGSGVVARRWAAAVIARDEVLLFGDRLSVLPAVRLDWTEGIGENWIPALGVVVTPVPWLRLKGNIERSFRAPSFNELFFPDKFFARGNPDLRPERGRSADVGVELSFAELGPLSNLRFETSVFRNRIEDSIVWFLVNPTTRQPLNTGPATEEGVEIAASLGVTRYLDLSTNVTLLDATIDATGVDLPGRAPLEAHFRIELHDAARWKLLGEMHFTDAMSINEGGTLRTTPRTVWDVSAALNLAGYPSLLVSRWLASLWLTAKVHNVGDVSIRDAEFFPQPGRSFTIGIEGSFE